MIDNITKQRIEKLHPDVRDEVTQIIEECNQALTGRAKVRVSQGIRSMEEQKALYAIGRTKPGKKVTQANAGQSIHNYGLAVDIVLIIDGKTASWDTAKDWDGDRVADWMECVAIFKKHGWIWGGDWKSFKDLPHFEKVSAAGKAFKWQELLVKKKDENGYVKL